MPPPIRAAALVVLVTVSGTVGCGGSGPAPVSATGVVIVADHCGSLSKQASREAEETMSRLVEHCNAVPKQALTFRVVLDPSGAIGFAPAGDSGSDEVPLCVVTQKLRHHVHLSAKCAIDVRFEPTSVVAR